MPEKAGPERALRQLELLIAFFPRVDTALSIVLGVDIGMLAYLAGNSPPFGEPTLSAGLAVAAVVLLGASIRSLYYGLFPRLEGGGSSLIYFRSIAQRTEPEFRQAWLDQTTDEFTQDVLGQLWRNSEILTQKYDRLKAAFVWSAWALVPWVLSIANIFVPSTTP